MRRATLGCLVRRAWRTLRRLGEGLPAVYADVAVDLLRFYPEATNWGGTWIANHILYHGTGEYSCGSLDFKRRPSTLLKCRAFPQLWRRTPRRLFGLLETANSEQARRFAAEALRSDLRATLRTVEPGWVARLCYGENRIVHDLVVWILQNVPKFEQSAFAELGLREPVLTLMDSPCDAARAYAAAFARTHTRDLPLERLIALADNSRALSFALDRIEAFKGDEALPVDFVRRALLNPNTRSRAVSWLLYERIKAETLGVDVLKALADSVPGAEIPKTLLTFDRLRTLMLDARTPLRRLGIELAKWELARLAPPMPEIVALTETGHPEVKAFVREAQPACRHSA